MADHEPCLPTNTEAPEVGKLDCQIDVPYRVGGAKRRVGLALTVLGIVGLCAAGRWSRQPFVTSQTSKDDVTTAMIGEFSSADEVRCAQQFAWPCMGAMDFKGQGRFWILQAGDNRPGSSTLVSTFTCNLMTIPIGGRAYLAHYEHNRNPKSFSFAFYANINFYKTYFSFSVYLNGAGCGCVAAVYLTQQHYTTEKGTCGDDYYCDAKSMCGTKCAEYDLMEANMYAIRATIHSATDVNGRSAGLGNGVIGLTSAEYGPGSACIDTTQLFQVDVFFDGGDTAQFRMQQNGCVTSIYSVYYPNMDRTLSMGMTPVFSYWRSQDTSWFDGGICSGSYPDQCGSQVKIANLRTIDRESTSVIE